MPQGNLRCQVIANPRIFLAHASRQFGPTMWNADIIPLRLNLFRGAERQYDRF